jgi:hypothetical protein
MPPNALAPFAVVACCARGRAPSGIVRSRRGVIEMRDRWPLKVNLAPVSVICYKPVPDENFDAHRQVGRGQMMA